MALSLLSPMATASEEAQLFFSHDPQTVILRSASGGGYGGSESVIETTIYGDGTITVYRAPGFEDPGLWKGTLPVGRLDALLKELLALDLLEMDSDRLAERVRASHKKNCPLSFETDTGYQRLEISLDEVIIGGTSRSPVSVDLLWTGPSFDAKCNSDVPNAAKVWAAFKILRPLSDVHGLTRHEDLVLVTPAP